MLLLEHINHPLCKTGRGHPGIPPTDPSRWSCADRSVPSQRQSAQAWRKLPHARDNSLPTNMDASSSSHHPSLDIFTSAPIATVSPYIFSGFLEHLGRCIYGGILSANRTNFPYTPRSPCPEEKFEPTRQELLTDEGFRKDVLAVLRDELHTPLVRWPGGNYVSSYHWEDGIGPKSQRKRQPELAWGGEESNLFGTDE